MRPSAKPLWRLCGVALLAMGAAGSQALRESQADPAESWSPSPVALDSGLAAAAEDSLAVPAATGTELPPGEADVQQASHVDAEPPSPSSETRVLHRICRVTAYHDRGVTSAGVPSGLGQCAAPSDIPIGSTIHIPALGRTFVVTDRTHRRFRNSTVDLFIPCPDRCRQFGRKYLEVQVTLPEQKPSRPELMRAARRLAGTG